ncbi:EamA-like transporter family [Rubrobacter radiotolerans]|nr:DMT family transporter [Rubrobacter radiotolerans]AHY46077.1 EamA-like transporter family [Rubrobacter radiotolerans]SMC03830.1 EamA-like transporter family protein [Rubrobacter radiotolerans DSM 5868]
MSLREFGMLLALGALWGASFVFIRVAAPALGPFVLVEGRVALASLALVAYLAVIGGLATLRPVRERWRGFLLLGTLNAAVPFVLISVAQLRLTASFGAILNSTTPLFAAVIGAVWLGDALTARKVVGLVFGIAGVAVLVGWSPIPVDALLFLAVLASLGAALFYGIGGSYAKKSFAGIPPLAMAVGQLGGAAVVVAPFAGAEAATGGADLSAVVVASMLALALVSTAAAYLIYFRLLASVGPTKTLTVTLLVPVFGTFFGAALLAEPFGGGTLPGLVMILASVLFVNEVRFGKSPKQPAEAR